MEGWAGLIEVLRMGERAVRDDRVTTHVALVARAFGASRAYMTETCPDIAGTIEGVNREWGGGFEVVTVGGWREVVRERRAAGSLAVHLTMYGGELSAAAESLRGADMLVMVSAGKAPRDAYEMADANVSVGSQPHSEVAALAVFLDRVQGGAPLYAARPGARSSIVPDGRGKTVVRGPGADG